MKASEVFDLPLTADGCLVYQSRGDEYAAEFDSSKKAYVAAHAINHADTLADALESIIGLVDVTNEDELSALDLAKAALAAYRGVK